MNCQTVTHHLSACLDERLPVEEVRELRRHLDLCADCALRYRQTSRLRDSLRSLPPLVSPPELAIRLRVQASQERLRLMRRSSFGAVAAHWISRLSLWSENLMRPVAIPVAGGLVSAVVLFSMLAPTFTVQTRFPNDVPLPPTVTSEAGLHAFTAQSLGLHSSPFFNLSESDIVVDLLVDEQGRMVDYSLPYPQKWTSAPAMLHSVENALLSARFTPATRFGQPANGRIRITLRRSMLDVKG